MGHLQSVNILFENEKHNYSVLVSQNSTKEDCEIYFKGRVINRGNSEDPVLVRCIGVEFEENPAPADSFKNIEAHGHLIAKID